MTGAPPPEPSESPEERSRNGLISALLAYSMWGVLPIYFKVVQAASPLEVLVHRVVWAVPFGALIIVARRQFPEVRRALASRHTLSFLVLSALLIAFNWYLYIVAVQRSQVFQASLGYYINPLMYVVVGVVFFRERLRALQTAAVLLAAAGVTVLTTSGGEFPWIAIVLAVSFTIYTVIRKQVVIGGMPGLFIETLILLPAALGSAVWLVRTDIARFAGGDTALSFYLSLAGPITVLPLLFFALAARRLQLTTIAMIQFLAPTLQFLIGLWYGERMTPAHVMCFSAIWTAISLFSWDAWRQSRKIRRLRAAA